MMGICGDSVEALLTVCSPHGGFLPLFLDGPAWTPPVKQALHYEVPLLTLDYRDV